MITSWTSESMDFADLANRELRVCYLEAIRLALLERLTVLPDSIGTFWYLPGPNSLPDPAWAIGNEIDLYEIFDYETRQGNKHTGEGFSFYPAGRIQHYIDLLIPLYCDHTTAGSWDGASAAGTAPVVWTEANLMAHLGQTRIRLKHDNRFSPGGLSNQIITAAWFKQQYDILNNLIWLRIDWASGISGNWPTYGSTASGYQSVLGLYGRPTWAEAQAEADGQWTAASPSTATGAPRQYTGGREVTPDYQGEITVSRNTVRLPVMRRFAADVDFYAKCEGYDVSDGNGVVTVDAWNFAGTVSVSKDTPTPQPGRPNPNLDPEYIDSAALGSVAKPNWVATPPSTSWYRRGWQVTDAAAAVKYDQDPTNGFQFIAP